MFQTHHVRGKRFAAAMIIAAGLLVAACGGDDDDSDSSSAGDAAATTAAAAGDTSAPASGGDAAATAGQFMTVPTEIVQTEPLSKPPDPKKVTFIVCADPSCVVLGDYLKEATTALGWDPFTRG